MKNLFAFEFRKLFRSKSFYIILAVITANFLLQALLLYSLSKGPDPWGDVPTAFSLLSGTASTSGLLLCVGIFIALFSLDDFGCGAIKTVYGKGYSRGAVFAAKFIVVELCTLFFFAFACGLNFGCGMLFFKKGTMPARLAATLCTQLVVYLAYGAVYFWFTAICKKVGGSVAAVVFVPSVFQLFVALVETYLQKLYKNLILTKYTLTAAMNSLAAGTVSSKTLSQCLTVALIYGVVFTLLSYLSHRKREI